MSETTSVAYQRFVKTTPKPRATKKSRGELVGPLEPLLVGELVAAGAAEEVVVDIMVDNVPCVYDDDAVCDILPPSEAGLSQIFADPT